MDFYVSGLSGSGGCGGDGINRADRMKPKAVAFFDTCPSEQMRLQVLKLRIQKTSTLVLLKNQMTGNPQYDDAFDYSTFIARLGAGPVSCPTNRAISDLPLRDVGYKCAGSKDGCVDVLVVDTGSQGQGHGGAFLAGFRYFLETRIGP